MLRQAGGTIRSFIARRAVLGAVVCCCAACGPLVPRAAFELRPESLALRRLQTRRFETGDERELLTAAAALLQDMGFQIDESEAQLGLLVGSKQADAADAGQIAGAIVLGAFTGARVPVDTEQRIRVSLVTRPLGTRETALRVTFQRTVWNSERAVSRAESIEDARLYQDFFDRLSKAVFLGANEL